MKHKLLITALLILIAAVASYGQNLVLNGSFESNKATRDMINCTNNQFDTLMSNVKAYGFWGNPDIIESDQYCNFAEDKKWFVGLTGGGTDAIAMTLSSPIVAGQKYALSYWDEACDWANFALEVGVSTNDTTFGTQFYMGPVATQGKWVEHIDTFTATTTGLYLTFKGNIGDIGYWTQLDNVSVTPVNPGPVVTLNMPSTGCSNQTISVSADSSSTVSYSWNFGNANVISATGTGSYQLSWANAGIYYISLTATDSNGTTTVIDSITINATPTATFAADTIIIAGQTDLVNYTGNGQAAQSTFNWNLNNAIVENNSGNDSLNITWAIPGIYNVALSVTENGCSSLPIQQQVIVVSPLTVATPVCSDSICMISYSTLAFASGSYSWSFPGGNIMAGSGAGPYTLQYITPGKYPVSVTINIDSTNFTYIDTVDVTNGANCYNHVKDSVLNPINNGDTSSLTSGINTVNQKFGISNIYPNPTLSVLNVDLKNVAPGTIHLIIYDVLGRTVISNDKSISEDESSIILDTNDLPAGSYFLRISNDVAGYSDAQKFVKVL